MLYNKKAAMFGLDARIALAIFGALSVITGASLYSALGKIEVTKTITSMNEFGKAWEQYYVDTRSNIVKTSGYMYNVVDLIKKPANVKDWKGPYYPAVQKGSDATTLIYPNNDDIFLSIREYRSPNAGACTASECYVWIQMRTALSNYDDTLIKAIDKTIDKSDGASVGNFEWWKDTSNGQFYYWLKYQAIRKQ